MKLYDGGKIFLGLAVFVGLMLLATVINFAKGTTGKRPKLELPAGEKACVRPTAWMRENHMKLLDDWRQSVVRTGNRQTFTLSGKVFEQSLTKTCLRCHQNKAAFCDRCHQYAGVTRKGAELGCWNCHTFPKAPAPAVAAGPGGR